MFGVYYNKYDNELEIYKIFSDGSRRKVAILYEKNDFVHVDIRANNFLCVIELENKYGFFSHNMNGVSLNVLYSDCIDKGMKDLGDNETDET